MLGAEKIRQEWSDALDRAVRDKFRFAVRRPDGRHSHTWAIWGKKNDFYIAPRSIGGQIKTSLHNEGGFRVHFDKRFLQHLKTVGKEPPKREVAVWPKPAIPATGAVHVASVVFPTNYLTADAPKPSTGKRVFVFDAPVGSAVEAGFFYSQEDMATLERKFRRIGMPCLYTTLDNGHSVSTVFRVRDFDPNVLPKVSVPSERVRLLGDDGLKRGKALVGLHALLFNNPTNDQALQIIEVGGVEIRHDL